MLVYNYVYEHYFLFMFMGHFKGFLGKTSPYFPDSLPFPPRNILFIQKVFITLRHAKSTELILESGDDLPLAPSARRPQT